MRNEETIFIVSLLVIMLLMTVFSFSYSPGAKTLPLLCGISASIMMVFLLLITSSSKIARWYQKFEDKSVSSTEVSNSEGKKKEISVVTWFSGCIVAIYFLGYMTGVTLLLFLFLKIWGKESWLLSLLTSAVVMGVVYFAFVYILRVPLHKGILFE